MTTESIRSRGWLAGRKSAAGSSLARSFRYLRRHLNLALIAYGALLLANLGQLMMPQVVQRLIDTITNGILAQRLAGVPASEQAAALQRLGWTAAQYEQYAHRVTPAVLGLGALTVVVAVVRGAFAYLQGFYGERISQSIAYDLRNDLYARIQRLSFSYHDRAQTGQLMIRATDDVEKVRLFLGQGLVMLLSGLVLLTCTLAISFVTNRQLVMVMLPVLPLAALAFALFGRLIQPLFLNLQERLARLNTVLHENLAGVRVVKALAREPEQLNRFVGAADDLYTQTIKLARVFALLFPLVFLIANLGAAAILYVGGTQIISGSLTLGEYQTFTVYLMFLFFPLGQLGMIVTQFAQAGASARRIFEILDAPIEVADKPNAIPLPPLTGRIEFQHVTFRYFGRGEPALTDVSLIAEPGQTIALLGATGSGKSTIINLIPRFYDATEGRVLIDGYDVRDVQIESLRRQIGIVLQDTTLFSGTIRQNIAFGRPDASIKEIVAAAQAAQAHEFIAALPAKYDTPVGERGITLSGGQRQRLAIARALLLDPRILILDDSTSSVDAVTEGHIQQTLSKLMRGRTSVVIAQRISTVRNADRIAVLDQGRLVAWGSHDELLESSPIYADIYHSQLIDDARVDNPDDGGLSSP